MTRAAEKLFVSQPAVTLSIRELENELGVKLFLRQGNRILPTKESHIFYKMAVELLRHAETVAVQMRGIGSQRQEIRVAIPYVTSVYLIPEMIRFKKAFQKKYPFIHLSFIEDSHKNLLNLLMAEETDLIVSASGYYNVDTLEEQELCQNVVYFCVNEKHPLAAQDLITPSMIADLPLATCYQKDALSSQLILKWFAQEGHIPNNKYYFTQTGTLVQMLFKNEAAALLRPEMFALPECVRCIPLKNPIRISLSIYWSKQGEMNSATLSLLEELREFYFSKWEE